MEDLSRAEYPAMLANLHPNQAVHALNDRVKRISKVNTEIADWLQERRKVEEQYVQGLKRLTQFRVPNAQSELGTFQAQWDKIIQSADALAMSHHIFATKVEKDVETPLRSFHQKKEMMNLQTIQGNLQNMAKELEDAQERSDKLSRKGGKASAQKVELAAGKLEFATQQWESQAPFVFESLQALDESRMNQLRDCLTQYGTYEGEQAQSHQAEAETVLNSLLDYSTATEIQNFVAKTTVGRPKIEKRTTTARQSSSLSGGNSSLAPPSIHAPAADDRSEHSVFKEGQTENKLRSRIGTMLGRRRQSIHGGFGPLSPAKGPFGRNIKSSHGVSPRASSSNLGDSTNRLGSLVEDPLTTETPSRTSETKEKTSHDGMNGLGRDGSTDVAPAGTATSQASHINGTSIPSDIADVPPPPGPPPSQKEPEKDSEGFSVPAPSNDPISQAEREAAAQEAEQLFKLNIQKEPVAEEDPEEKKAALSNVANSLSAMGIPARKGGTIRGRRDVRNTIYVPAPVSEGSATEYQHPFPPLHAISSKPAGVATLASEASVAGTSDTQSVRSGNSLSSTIHVKHPDMHEPGLNSSVMETVSATFENGEVRGVKINGEIAFSYNASDFFNLPIHLPIRINNFATLDVIGPNRIFVTNDTPEHPEQFTLDLSHLHKTSIGFSYRLHVDPDATATEHVPVLVHPVWKPQGDKLGLLLQYKLNPAFKLADGGSSVQVHNLVLFATYEGKASGAQTKPSGTHLKDKHLVYWRLGDVTLSPDADWQKIVCRIIGDQGVEPKPGAIEARWEVNLPSSFVESASAISVSKFEEGKSKEVELTEDDPFADDTAAVEEGKWVDVPTVRKLVSGKYEAR
ncbi:Muniscin C-terminal mu homology domain-containing protein [Daldinia decipiens]|uniref:Muniscin C-terminal mu homology domain-containing protein n=1 Tax=Daldinia decipiens TaxID=326647 RepID=UPI0020C2367E|nr:Muniscin C-terminal mu homology domain-containing protein [Daldinia decipiens]KAI1657858.1 Muniscin C-terminal mu homology domain-containing protein [Daldinia decipiens]